MVKVMVTVDIPNTTIADLRQKIHEIDSLDDPHGPIAPEGVRPQDIMLAVLVGDLPTDHEVETDFAIDDGEYAADESGIGCPGVLRGTVFREPIGIQL